jgi:hypothetical protein
MVTVDTKQKTGRKPDRPRSCWSCSCGAGNPRLQSPDAANAEADAHIKEIR